MSKIKTSFVCESCGAHSPQWLGQCRECKTWNSFVEEVLRKSSKKAKEAAGKSEPVS